MLRKVVVQTEDFDVGMEISNASGVGKHVGAVVSFVGLCRDEGSSLSGIDLESYPAMAYLELDAIITAASARWALESATVIHRYGRILIGDRIVLVAVASRHRGEAFAAADFIMDFLKQDAPFWKRELLVNSEREVAYWVDPKLTDAIAVRRWAPSRTKVKGDE
jgi:molybdopterin synthase catalytic subunit